MLHTIHYIDTTGGTYYAFPSSQSLANWATYRVLLAELTGANLGKYEGSVDDANGSDWIVFAGGTQPANWDVAIDVISLSAITAATQTSEAAIKAATRLALNGRVTNVGSAVDRDDVTWTDIP